MVAITACKLDLTRVCDVIYIKFPATFAALLTRANVALFGGLIMRRLQCALLAAVAVIGFASIASAADMPVKARPMAPIPAVYNWTGFYAGLHAGGAWGRSKAIDNPDAFATWNLAGDTFTSSNTGFVGGIQAGYNWQMNMLVAGIEGDFGYLGFRGSQASSLSSDTIVSARGGAYGTLRGRLGVAWNQILLYGTGGLMVADVKASVDDNSVVPGGGLMNSPKTGTQAGWTAGGGLEYALGNKWSVKGEWLHFDLGTKTMHYTAITGGNVSFSIKNSGDIVRVGLNYKY